MFDGTGKPDERDSSSAQIRTLLEEQRQMLIAEYCEKIGHHELQAARAEEERQILQEELWRQQQNFREVHQQSYWDGGITKIPKFYLRYARKTEAHRGPKNYYGIIRQSTGTSKWSKLCERFLGFSGCGINSQWKFTTLPVDQCHSHFIQFLVECWAVLLECPTVDKDRQAFGTHMIYLETFLQIHMFPLQLLIFKNWINGGNHWRAASYVYSGEEWKTRTKSRSEMPVWTVSQRFSHLLWRRLFKELWCRSTTAEIRISILTSSLHQKPSFAGRSGSRPRYVLVHNFLRKRCNGSKKWSL